MITNNVTPMPGRQNPVDTFDVFTPAIWYGQGVPAQDWIIGDLIAAGTVAMVSGDGGLGKSLLVQQLMTAAALGVDWLGFPVKPVRSLGIFCEDPPMELHRRQASINDHYECDMPDLGESMHMQCRLSRESYLASFDFRTDEMKPSPLWSQIEYFCRENGIQILVLDTVRKTFGGNEIRDKQVSRFISMLRRLAIGMQGCVILTAHPSNEGVTSGSGLAGSRAWNNDVRSRMYLTAEKGENKENHRVLKTLKSNYSKSGGKVDIVWDRGVFRRSEPATPLRDYSEVSLPGW